MSSPGGDKIDTERFFTDVFNNLTPEELENYHKTVFMYMDAPFAMGKRIRYYQTRLKHMGKNVQIGCGVKIVNPQYISLGHNVEIGDNCVLAAFSKKGIILNDGTRLKHGVYLNTTELDTGNIKIGKRAFLGAGCCLYGHRGLEIADDSLLAQNVLVVPYSHRFDNPNKNIFGQVGYSRKITIGRDCYIGMNACILYSADIGEGSVVGAGSVVVHTIPPYSVAVGVPARVIRKRGKN